MEKLMQRDYDEKFFTFKNISGETITLGSIVYYPVMDDRGLTCRIEKSKVEAIVFIRNHKRHSSHIGEVYPMILTRGYILDVDDVRKSYEGAEGVIKRWEEKIVKKIKETVLF